MRLAFVLFLPALAAMAASKATAEEDRGVSRENLEEPLLRVAKATSPNTHTHPLDPALELAKNGLKHIRGTIDDYTATLVKRERIGGELGEYEYIYLKVRNRKVRDGRVVAPFSVYMYFLKPDGVKGREVMYVEGRNNGKMVAHEGGTAGKYLPTVWIRPEGVIAMRGQRYPITEIGIENLILKLIERGEQDRASGREDCEVALKDNAKVNGRVCKLLQVKNHHPSPDLAFHMAQVFIDKEHNVPIRYAAYDFPPKSGSNPPVIEEYTYLNLQLNVGLTDRDFDHTNSDYNFE
jgi:hypothetical protein